SRSDSAPHRSCQGFMAFEASAASRKCTSLCFSANGLLRHCHIRSKATSRHRVARIATRFLERDFIGTALNPQRLWPRGSSAPDRGALGPGQFLPVRNTTPPASRKSRPEPDQSGAPARKPL